MPEPVVIVDPANRPAEPTEEAAETPARDNDSTAMVRVLRLFSPLRAVIIAAVARAVAAGGWLAKRARWVLGLVAKGVMAVAVNYPRHSLAAGASLLILGGIWYSQWRQEGALRGPVTAQIKGDPGLAPPKKADKAETPPANPPAKNGEAEKPSEPKLADNKSTPANPLGAADPVSAPPSGSTPAPAPAPRAGESGEPPLPALASAPASASSTDPAPGPGPEIVASDPGPGEKPAPAPSPSSTTPTLLASASPEPAPAPAAASGSPADPKLPTETDKPAPAPAPAPTQGSPAPVVVAPVPVADPDHASPALPAGDSLQLANRLEPAGDPAKTPGTPENPPKAAPAPASAPAQTKETPAPLEGPALAGAASITDPPATPQDATKSKPSSSGPEAPKSNPAPVADTKPADSKPAETKGPETKAPETKLPDPAPGSSEPSPKPDAPSTPPAALEIAPPRADSDAGAKPSMETPAASPAPAIGAPVTTGEKAAIGTAAALATGAAAAAAIAESSKPADAPKQSEPPKPDAKPAEAPPKRRGRDLESEGWVALPNSGKINFGDESDAGADDSPAPAAADIGTRTGVDARAHAAKNASFEFESLPARSGSESGRGAAKVAADAGAAAAASRRGRVDAVPHVVEPNENFWTISRLYYSSGRYYRALWKANADTHPDIKKLKVNDVINIPPVEDLDPAYIDPPRARETADSRAGSEQSLTSSVATRTRSGAARRANSSEADGVPIKRSSRSDPDLDLPPPRTVSRRGSEDDRSGRGSSRADDDPDADQDAASRTTARPRAAGSARRPVYKIRPFDTLRSIARDRLGDSHRSNEILELNRDLIDDPSHLIVGQLIELPEDARTSVRR
jgi:hypothetical protein